MRSRICGRFHGQKDGHKVKCKDEAVDIHYLREIEGKTDEIVGEFQSIHWSHFLFQTPLHMDCLGGVGL